MILLPYLTPLQRLVLALQQGVSTDDAEFGFYVDPVGYLRGLDGSDIGEIVFVLPSGPEDARRFHLSNRVQILRDQKSPPSSFPRTRHRKGHRTSYSVHNTMRMFAI